MRKIFSKPVHPFWLRCCHWINVLAFAGMLFSGFRIYNATPLFSFAFPSQLTLGGWLGGALQWHFAIMWILVVNAIIYFSLGVMTGRFCRRLFPLSLRAFKKDLLQALKGELLHANPYKYNMVQKIAYLLLLIDGIGLVLSGLVLWKSVQFSLLSTLLGGYEVARYIHFLCMSFMVLFVVVHLLMVMLVPRTLLTMLRAR